MGLDRGGFGVAACLLASFITTYSLMMVAVSLDDISESLGIGNDVALLFTWSPVISTFAMSTFSSSLASRFGKRNVMVAGLVITAVTSILIFFTTSFQIAVALRMMQGAGMSFLYVTMVSMLTDLSKEDRLDRNMGLNVVFSQSATVVAIILGYVCTPIFGWQSLCIPLIPLSILAMVMIWRVPNTRKSDFDPKFLDNVLLASSISMIMYGLGTISMGRHWLVLAGVVLLAVFFLRQRNRDNWVFNYNLFGNRAFRTACIGCAVLFTIVYNVTQLTFSYVQFTEDNGLLELVIVFQMVTPIITAAFTPLVTKRYGGSRRVAAVTLGLILAAFSVLALTAVNGEEMEDMILISAVFIAAGLASALFTAPNMAIMMSTVDEGDRNDASSMNNFLRQFSKINGTIFMMLFMAGVSSDRLYNTFHQGLILFGVLMTVLASICVVIFWRYGRSVRSERRPLGRVRSQPFQPIL